MATEDVNQGMGMYRTETRPTPDPTVLTTEQLLREIDSVKKLISDQIAAVSALRDAKLQGMEVSLNARFDGIENNLDVRFKGIEREFVAIENWRKEQKLDTKTAVDAALQAAEKAVREQTVASEKSITKSETSANEQSKQQYATFTASLKGVTDTVADIKDRISKIEAIRLGAAENHANSRLDLGTMFGLIGAIVAIISVAVVLGR